MSMEDLRAGVRRSVEGFEQHYDTEAIVTELAALFGPVTVDEIPDRAYWVIIRKHDVTSKPVNPSARILTIHMTDWSAQYQADTDMSDSGASLALATEHAETFVAFVRDHLSEAAKGWTYQPDGTFSGPKLSSLVTGDMVGMLDGIVTDAIDTAYGEH